MLTTDRDPRSNSESGWKCLHKPTACNVHWPALGIVRQTRSPAAVVESGSSYDRDGRVQTQRWRMLQVSDT